MHPPDIGATLSALVVDDEPLARRRLIGVLRRSPLVGRIDECDSGRGAVAAIRESAPDLVFLDIQMPDLDGFEVLAGTPAEQRPAVIFVTAFDDYAVKAFAVHAFDYLLKPFDDERVLDSVQRAVAFLEWQRHAHRERPDRFGEIRVDFDARQVYRAGAPVAMRPKEFELLEALLTAGGRVVTRTDLLRAVWGYADDAETRTVDTHVSRLRMRLEDDPARPRHIVTVRSLGYRIDGVGGVDDDGGA